MKKWMKMDVSLWYLDNYNLASYNVIKLKNYIYEDGGEQNGVH